MIDGSGQSYAEALSKLFGLDQSAVDAVTRADIEVAPGDDTDGDAQHRGGQR
jgi:hypothetical protein